MKTIADPASLKGFLPANGETAILFVMSACPFCRAFRPVFGQWASGQARECLTVVLDDMESPLWDELSIEVVPTVILFKGNVAAVRLDGRPGEGLTADDLKRLG